MDEKMRTVAINCPMCQVTNHIRVDEWGTRALVICDVDEGGCDKPFAIEIILVPEVKVYTLVEADE